jgi:hypothetical protein
VNWKLIATPLIVLVPLVGAGVSGCASATPKAAEQPGLVIPPPPPHVVPINAEPIAEPVGDVPGAPSTPGGTPATRNAGRGTREVPPKPAASESKPETKPETPPAQPETPPPPAAPPPQLRTAESSGTEVVVRGAIERTRQILGTVDYRKLTPVRRKAYDDAKKFADQADDALKQGNVVFAQGVAGKAETLAKELAGR